MQALNVAAILLTGSACSVLLLQARHRLLICRIPALVIFLLLDLPLYGILLYLHADTAEALLRRAVLGGGFAIGCIVIALLFQRRKKALLSYGGELVSVTASLQLFTLLYTVKHCDSCIKADCGYGRKNKSEAVIKGTFLLQSVCEQGLQILWLNTIYCIMP